MLSSRRHPGRSSIFRDRGVSHTQGPPDATPVLDDLCKSAPLPFSTQNARKAGMFVRLRSCARVPSYRVRVDHVMGGQQNTTLCSSIVSRRVPLDSGDEMQYTRAGIWDDEVNRVR